MTKFIKYIIDTYLSLKDKTKHIVFIIAISVFISLFISLIATLYTINDIYLTEKYELLKQQEKEHSAKNQMRRYDVIKSNIFCKKYSFQVYINWQSPFERMRLEKICKLMHKIYISYPDL